MPVEVGATHGRQQCGCDSEQWWVGAVSEVRAGSEVGTVAVEGTPTMGERIAVSVAATVEDWR